MVTCRKFAPAARNYAAARLAADVGLRINEARMLDLADIRWELGRMRSDAGHVERHARKRLFLSRFAACIGIRSR